VSELTSLSEISETTWSRNHSVVHHYVIALIAGFFLVLAVNFSEVVGLWKQEGITIEVDGGVSSTEKADISRIRVTVARELADSQQAALREISQKAQGLKAFVEGLKGTRVVGSTPVMENSVVMIGSKKAVNYRAEQNFTVYISDFSQHDAILRKAAELEISSTSSVEFGFSQAKVSAVREALLAESLRDALAKATVKAKDSHAKLGSPSMFQIDRSSLENQASSRSDESGAYFPEDATSENIHSNVDYRASYLAGK
jgi:uncharacterized protein YggE